MATEKTGNKNSPVVRIAIACERVLHENDETLSVIRIIDRFVVKPVVNFDGSAVTPLPEQMPKVVVPITLLLSTIARAALGAVRI